MKSEIVVVIILWAFFTFIYVRLAMKNNRLAKKIRQQGIDLNIERKILDVSFLEIKKHSNQDRVAQLRAEAIAQLIEYGASPYAVYKLLARLNIAKPILSPETEQCHFQRKIQDHLYKLLDNLDMEHWMRISRKNEQEHWDLLVDTMFSNVRHNGFVMDLKLS